MKPTIGRIVHFVDSNEDENYCQAAIITSVDTENKKVSLTVFGKHGSRIEHKISEGKNNLELFTWHWPEREES